MRIKLQAFQCGSKFIVENRDFPVKGLGKSVDSAMLDFAQQMIRLNQEKPENEIALNFTMSSVSRHGKGHGIPHHQNRH